MTSFKFWGLILGCLFGVFFKVDKLGDSGKGANGQKHTLSAGLEDFYVEIWAGSNLFENCNSSAGFLVSCCTGGP